MVGTPEFFARYQPIVTCIEHQRERLTEEGRFALELVKLLTTPEMLTDPEWKDLQTNAVAKIAAELSRDAFAQLRERDWIYPVPGIEELEQEAALRTQRPYKIEVSEPGEGGQA